MDLVGGDPTDAIAGLRVKRRPEGPALTADKTTQAPRLLAAFATAAFSFQAVLFMYIAVPGSRAAASS